jgi:hypothetical protein
LVPRRSIWTMVGRDGRERLGHVFRVKKAEPVATANGPKRPWLISNVGQRMKIHEIIGESLPLRAFVDDLRKLPDWSWLYCKESGQVTLSTPCCATLVDSRDLSESEAELRDEVLEKEGFRCLLAKEQIESVVANLRHRYAEPTLEQIEEALRFYLDHDAFIVV